MKLRLTCGSLIGVVNILFLTLPTNPFLYRKVTLKHVPNIVKMSAIFLLQFGCTGPIKLYLPTPITYPTSSGFTEMIETWDGAPSQRLVESWGTPSSTFDLGNGTTVWTYEWDRSYRTAQYTVTSTGEGTATTSYNEWTGQATTTYKPGQSTTSTYGGHLVTRTCRVQMHIKAGKISYWKWNGNDCKSVPKAKPHQCTSPGRATRIQTIGRAERTGTYGDAVRLMNGEVFIFKDDVGTDEVIQTLSPRTKVLTCYNSGIGSYLYTYPPPRNYIFRGDFR